MVAVEPRNTEKYLKMRTHEVDELHNIDQFDAVGESPFDVTERIMSTILCEFK